MISSDNYQFGVDTESKAFDSLLVGLERLGDALVLVSRQFNSLFWCSKAFSVAFPEIARLGCEALFECFNTLEDSLNNHLAQHQDAGRLDIVHGYINGEAKLYSVDFSTADNGNVLLRFNDLAEQATESKRYLEDREQLFSMSRTLGVSEMATALAHELNQPIGTLNNLLEGMRSRLPANSDLHYAIGLAQQQTRFSAGVITRIRDYTRRKKPKFALLNINTLLNECVALLDWELTRAQIKVAFDVEPDLSSRESIKGDHLMLQQVLVNLLRNAMDALHTTLPDSRQITVGAALKDGNVVIAISDNGCGITEEQKQRLFLPFSSSKPDGMGIGLNICRSFMELHHGRLWLDQNKFSGCTAFVSLPVLTEE